jgi:Uma2 family endonuclease
MTPAVQTLTLEAFLHLPTIEDSPAWEFIDGEMLQKPMPTTHHSILQK